MAQVAAGNGWETIVALVNVGTTAASATLSFFDDTGAPWTMPLSFPQTAASVTESSVSQTLQPGATLLISASMGSAQSTVGSAQLTTTGNIGAFTLFRDNLTGQEAGVPLETRNASGYVLPFDNTNNILTGVAVANISGQPVAIPVTLRDDTGASLGTTTLNLPANGHIAFMMNDATNGYPATLGRRGTVEFDKPSEGQISILGLRATPIPNTTSFAVTTLRPLAK
jgi:hypothetical protein